MSLNKHYFSWELFFPSDKIVLSMELCVYEEHLSFYCDNTEEPKLGKFLRVKCIFSVTDFAALQKNFTRSLHVDLKGQLIMFRF